jgi:hypothetical protein
MGTSRIMGSTNWSKAGMPTMSTGTTLTPSSVSC